MAVGGGTTTSSNGNNAAQAPVQGSATQTPAQGNPVPGNATQTVTQGNPVAGSATPTNTTQNSTQGGATQNSAQPNAPVPDGVGVQPTSATRTTIGPNGKRLKAVPKKEHDFLPSKRAKKVSYSLAILAMVMGTFVVFGNVLGTKIWGPKYFLLDAGILAFAVVWTAQDVMVQVFYKEITNFFCAIIAGVNLVALFLLFIATLLPVAPGVTNLNFNTLFEFSVRTFIASSVGYICRSLLNNRIFDAMRTTTDDREDIVLRSVVSSFFGRVIDTVLFTLIAFAGRGNFLAFWIQAGASFVAGMALEFVLSCLVTKPVSLWLIDYLQQQSTRPSPRPTVASATTPNQNTTAQAPTTTTPTSTNNTTNQT